MKVTLQISIILFICLVGEGISSILPFAFPGSVISMILLFLLLISKGLKVEHIEKKTDFLLQNMAIFFIPAGVGIMKYVDIIKSSIVQLLIVSVLTTFLTFTAAAFTVKLVIKLQNGLRGGSKDE